MADDKEREVTREELLRYATEIVAAYLGRNKVAGDQLSDVIHRAFSYPVTCRGSIQNSCREKRENIAAEGMRGPQKGTKRTKS